MKKFIETLKNCWRIEDLRQRLLITLLFTAIYRFGSFVVLPGINPSKLDQLQSQTAGGLMSLLDMFSGGAFSNASIFALGIMPYISASMLCSFWQWQCLTSRRCSAKERADARRLIGIRESSLWAFSFSRLLLTSSTSRLRQSLLSLPAFHGHCS